jgi:hypothetical protein
MGMAARLKIIRIPEDAARGVRQASGDIRSGA